MNPFDALEFETIDTPKKLAEALERRAGSEGPGARDAYRGAREALRSDPAMAGVWLLTSRHGGRPHPYDLAMADLRRVAPPQIQAPSEARIEASVRASTTAGDQREAVLKELVELPPLDEEPLFLKGLLVTEE